MACDRNLNNGTSPRVSLGASVLLPFPGERGPAGRSPRGAPAPGDAASLHHAQSRSHPHNTCSGPSGMHPRAFYKGNIARSASKHSHALFFRKVENFQLLYSFPLVCYQFKAIMQSVWHLFTDRLLLVLVFVVLHPTVLGWMLGLEALQGQHLGQVCVHFYAAMTLSIDEMCCCCSTYRKQFHNISGCHSYHKKLLEVFRDLITWLCHLKAYWKYIGIYSRGWVFLCLNYWKMLWLQDRVSNFRNRPNGFCLFLKPSKHFV